MPTPVSANNSSVYDQSPQVALTVGCDPANATCAISPMAATQTSPNEVTLPPVYVEGDAGARQLVSEFDAARESPSCGTEKYTAALDCVVAGATALGGVAAAATGVGAVAGFLLTTAMSANCAKSLVAVDRCEAQ
jgi:hypothetical protein